VIALALSENPASGMFGRSKGRGDIADLAQASLQLLAAFPLLLTAMQTSGATHDSATVAE